MTGEREAQDLEGHDREPRDRHPGWESRLVEVESLVADRYLDSLLAVNPAPRAVDEDPGAGLSRAVREASRRLAADLPRFHPSFRFEERLALRLAQIAASMRLPLAAGAEGQPVPLRPRQPAADPLAVVPDRDDAADRAESRPLLIGGAVAASAISLAGAWLAWRRRGASPMSRAARTAHLLRAAGRGG